MILHRLDRFRDTGLLVLRVGIGVMFMVHGYPKLAGGAEKWAMLGGALSAFLAGRFRLGIDRGPRTTDRSRLMYAFGGGVIMGLGAKLARGCTSGQALTGGALLSVGSWLFIAAAFAAGYLAAPLFRKEWT